MSAVAQIFYNLKGDKVIWLIITFLGCMSMLAVYSATTGMAHKYHGGNTEFYLIQQGVFLSLGAFVVFFCSKLDYRIYAKVAPYLLLLTVPLLIYTVGFGAQINDARRWIQLPFTDFTFQTSDMAKLALVLFIARGISRRQENIKDLKGAFLPIIIPVLVICGLIAPADLSTAALLFLTSLMMMFIGRMSMKYIIILLFLGLFAFGLLALLGTIFPDFIRVETWQTRFHEFFFNSDGGYQIQQSKMAIANGEFFGLGLGGSIQKSFLPSPYADFIYAIICEEAGMLWGFIIIFLYLGLLYRCTKLVTRCDKPFAAIVAMGLCLSIVIQAFANIAVSVHLLPVTGLTLPLLSMGGTSLIFTCISCGIILSVSRYVEEHNVETKKVRA